jgi:hypothetical protein
MISGIEGDAPPMSEITDVVLPILQKIQADIAGLKSDVSDLKGDTQDSREILERMQGYVTFTVGLHGENRADIQGVLADIADLKSRLAILEARV